MMRNYIIGGISALLTVATAVVSAAATSFIVTVDPDTFLEGEAVDVEIRSVDAAGEVVTDFVSDVFLGIDEVGAITQDEYTLPSDGFYQFAPSDQGVKTFSKGFIVKKPGTYTLYVEDIYDNTIVGKASFVVTDAGGSTASDAVVSISSPAAATTLDRTTTTLIGTTDSPRTPLMVELNGSLIDESFTTDQAGGFSVPVAGLQEGENTLILQLRNASDDILGVSEALTVTVDLDESPLLQSFSVDPVDGLMVGDDANLEAIVADRVTSASLLVDGTSYPLEATAANTYGGVMSFQDPGDYDMQLRLYVDGEMSEIDVDDLSIAGTGGDLDIESTVSEVDEEDQESYSIGMIQYTTDPLKPGSVSIVWDPDGPRSPHYTIYYGINPESLDTHFTVSSTGAVLSDLSFDTVTYVQVWPSTATGSITGDPSDPLTINLHASAPQCVVKGIPLRSEQRGEEYYLVWDAVDGAQNYTIYRAESEVVDIASMTVVGTTSSTSYQYPFDADATYEVYAYYAVQANCEGGLTEPVGGIEKIKTGPVSSSLLVLLLVVAVYFLYRVNVYQE